MKLLIKKTVHSGHFSLRAAQLHLSNLRPLEVVPDCHLNMLLGHPTGVEPACGNVGTAAVPQREEIQGQVLSERTAAKKGGIPAVKH